MVNAKMKDDVEEHFSPTWTLGKILKMILDAQKRIRP
jgi:hypothetical protein